MILNLFILAFIIAMAVMWATYGLFSAVLHLLVVVISGALAFAFWELFAYKVFMGFMPSFAWGTALLLPFGLFVIGLRVALDSLVRGNMQMPRLADQIAGGATGAISGILTAGIVVIGIGYLPLGHDLAGYRPIEVQSNGKVAPAPGGGLWISVDSITANFYSKLSGGAFGTSTPLKAYLPHVDEQAALFRLARFYDPHQSLVASPSEVSLAGLHRFSEDAVPNAGTAVNDWLINNKGSGTLLLANLKVTKQAGGSTFDSDSVLRLPPTQVRLNVQKQDGSSELLAPIGFSKTNEQNRYEFFPVANNQIFVSSAFPDQTFNFIFAVPSGATPYFLLVRNTRLALPETQNVEGVAFTDMVGNLAGNSDGAALPPTPTPTAQSGESMDVNSTPTGYTNHRVAMIQQTASLPRSVSKNNVQFLDYTDDGAAEKGQGTAKGGAGGKGNSVDRVFVNASAQRPLRLKIVPVGAELFTGQTDATSNVQEIWLSDTRGQAYRPFAWVIERADGDQTMRIEADEFRNNTDLPLNDLRQGDTLYVYWRVPAANLTIDKYNVGASQQDIGFNVK